MPMPDWCVVVQRSGPLTKTYFTDRHKSVAWAARQQCRDGPSPGPYMWGTSEDKLELYLALFGFAGAHYVLTFRDDDLPPNFDGVKRCFRAFTTKARRWRPEALKKYVYAVEAGHEKGRWHIHFVADAQLLSLADVSGLWRYGFVNPGKAEYPVLHAKGGFHCLAHYFCKPDKFIPLGKHPWGVAEGMKAMIPPPSVRVQQRRPGIPQKNYYCSYRTKDPVRVVNGHSSALMEYASWVALPKPGEYIYRPEKPAKTEAL